MVKGHVEVSGLVCDSLVIDAFKSPFGQKLSGSLFGESKGVNPSRSLLRDIWKEQGSFAFQGSSHRLR